MVKRSNHKTVARHPPTPVPHHGTGKGERWGNERLRVPADILVWARKYGRGNVVLGLKKLQKRLEVVDWEAQALLWTRYVNEAVEAHAGAAVARGLGNLPAAVRLLCSGELHPDALSEALAEAVTRRREYRSMAQRDSLFKRVGEGGLAASKEGEE